VGALVGEAIERPRVANAPPMKITRRLVDHTAYSRAEYDLLRNDFRRRLEALVAYCEQVGALTMLVVPPGNDGDFPPCRSVMSPGSTGPEREAFARDFLAARALEASDPARARVAYRALLARQPGFAEAHYRLARLLDGPDEKAEAHRHYVAARDLDGLPMRLPSDFQDAYFEVASRHDVVLVDGPALLGGLSPRGVGDDRLFHDAQHPNLRGYAALARALLERLKQRGAFGWPEGRPAPEVSAADCARHFGMDARRWATVCERAATFYKRTASIRYDPSESLEKARRYADAAKRLASGQPPGLIDLVGLGE
jgi:hypothetical protein